MSNQEQSRRRFLQGARPDGERPPRGGGSSPGCGGKAQGRTGPPPTSKGAGFAPPLPPASRCCSRSSKASCSPGCASWRASRAGSWEAAGWRRGMPCRTPASRPSRKWSTTKRGWSNTDLPIVADGENGGGSPVITYRTVQQLERGGATVIVLEDSTGPESGSGGKGVAMAPREVMVGRIKAAVDAPAGREHHDHGAMRPAGEGLLRSGNARRAGCSLGGGSRRVFIERVHPGPAAACPERVEEAADDWIERTGSQWHAKGVDMAFYHIDDIGIGAMYIALKEMKAKGGSFDEAARWRLPRDVSARPISQPEWLARAQSTGSSSSRRGQLRRPGQPTTDHDCF